MQFAIRDSDRACRELGLTGRVGIEKGSGDGASRYDLIGDGVVVECKVAAVSSDLGQLDRYMRTLEREDPRTAEWRGRLVGYSPTRELVRAAKGRENIQVWRCRRGPDGEPRLEQLA